MVERLNQSLHLTPDQKKQVADIFERAHPRMMALRSKMKPKFEALRNSTQTEIRKILTPNQQEKFDETNVKMEERWKKCNENFALEKINTT